MHTLKKLLRDSWYARGRTMTMVVSIAVGLAAFNAVLGAYGILTRELPRNYVATVPASATLELDSVSDELLARVRARSEVGGAVRRRTLHARFRNHEGESWRRALVFVIDDFEEMPLAKLIHERGAWPPPTGTVLLERSALPVIGGDVGHGFWLKTPRGTATRVEVSGVVHEPALAPANTEQAIYAYATEDTLKTLEGPAGFDELRVLVSEHPGDRAHIEGIARELARFIEGEGLARVHRIRVPPPLTHPHQSQMTAILVLFLMFSLVVLALSSVLTASLVGTMMARQIREIAVLKTIGVRTWQLVREYALVIEIIAIAAMLIAIPFGRWGAELWSQAVARLLNFDLASTEQPAAVTLIVVLAGLSVPVAVTLPTVLRTARTTVRRAFSDYGVENDGFGRSRVDRWLVRLGGARTALVFALRNALRRRRRFVLALGLLAVAGGAFVGARSTALAWDTLIASLEKSRHYDLEVHLEGPAAATELASRLEQRSDVDRVEAWGALPISVAHAGHIPIETTYPDDGHGALTLLAPPAEMTLVDMTLSEGRWLAAGDVDAVVINQIFPGAAELAVGDRLVLFAAGKAHRLELVGKVEEVGVGATAYVTSGGLEHMTSGTYERQLRVAAAPGHGGERLPELVQGVDRELEAAGADVASILPLAVFENAVAAHFELLVRSLLALAALIGVVGALGLGSSMSANIVERTRELAVLRAIGAGRGMVLGALVVEGVGVAVASVLGAFVSGVALALVVGEVVGQMSFRLSLPLTFDHAALLLWLGAAVVLAIVATLLPALRALRMTVRRGLDSL